ncbi:MAG: hypothetical protein Kow0083_14020 [Methylophaga sp.]
MTGAQVTFLSFIENTTMKKTHQYKINIEHIRTPDGAVPENEQFEFEFSSHDELLNIMKKLETRPDIEPESAAPLGLGIKLFGSVMLANRSHALFANLFPHFAQFMKQLKQRTN